MFNFSRRVLPKKWPDGVVKLCTYFFILSLNLPDETSRYTCSSTRWPGAGLKIYLQTVGPKYGIEYHFLVQ